MSPRSKSKLENLAKQNQMKQHGDDIIAASVSDGASREAKRKSASKKKTVHENKSVEKTTQRKDSTHNSTKSTIDSETKHHPERKDAAKSNHQTPKISKASKTQKDNADKYVDDILSKEKEQTIYEEDTQDRIRRMTGGGMTDEEKQAFLNTALTSSLPRAKPRGPPIRQKIPGMDDADTNGGGEKRRGDDETVRVRHPERTRKGGALVNSDHIWDAVRYNVRAPANEPTDKSSSHLKTSSA